MSAQGTIRQSPFRASWRLNDPFLHDDRKNARTNQLVGFKCSPRWHKNVSGARLEGAGSGQDEVTGLMTCLAFIIVSDAAFIRVRLWVY